MGCTPAEWRLVTLPCSIRSIQGHHIALSPGTVYEQYTNSVRIVDESLEISQSNLDSWCPV